MWVQPAMHGEMRAYNVCLCVCVQTACACVDACVLAGRWLLNRQAWRSQTQLPMLLVGSCVCESAAVLRTFPDRSMTTALPQGTTFTGK